MNPCTPSQRSGAHQPASIDGRAGASRSRQAQQIAVAVVAIAVAGCGKRTSPDDAVGLQCVFDPAAPITECPHVGDLQQEQPLTLSDTRELEIEGLTASRTPAGLVLDVHLAGRFWNEIDQNLYVFLGGPAPPSGTTKYALSADPTYAAEVGYPVRAAVDVPHSIDVRVGIMAPSMGGYSPQVYTNDPVHAVAVGADAITALRVTEGDVHLEIPLERYYAQRHLAIPERLGVTVATARDYVGFVDQRSVREILPGATAGTAGRDLPPTHYPRLDPRAHRFERVALRSAAGAVSVELDMAAPITDWAQTNLHFFFVPVPTYPSSKPLSDPSHTQTIPFKWSFYCGVYSPRRLFCKASNGKDFTFDAGYAERASLAPPPDIAFRERGAGRYALDLGAEHGPTILAGRRSFAIIVSAGRDGFGPTTWYGSTAPAPRR